MSLQDTIQWFEDLKKQGITGDEVLDVLEFDSDVNPDMAVLNEAKRVVFGEVEKPAKTNAEFDAALAEFLVTQGIDKKDIKIIFAKPLPKKGES